MNKICTNSKRSEKKRKKKRVLHWILRVSTYVITVLWPFAYFSIRNKTNGITRVFHFSRYRTLWFIASRGQCTHCTLLTLFNWFWKREKFEIFEKLKDKKTHFFFFLFWCSFNQKKDSQKQNTECSLKKISNLVRHWSNGKIGKKLESEIVYKKKREKATGIARHSKSKTHTYTDTHTSA